jgi:predicted molibdopterin-dependent oxidoreductase YjgC
VKEDLRIGDADTRGEPVRFRVDDQWIESYEGETVAAALWASGIRNLRSSPVLEAPRGMFCYMGVCQECVVLIDGKRETSCSFPVSNGLDVSLLRSR